MRKLIFSARKKDFRVDTFASGGPGGQHQNKTQSGVRITHLESGLSAESREHREQPRNRKAAFQRLAKRLVRWALEREQPAEEASAPETIRTYHAVENRVKDHASGHRQTFDEVLADPEAMIDARRKAMLGEKA